MLFVCSSANPPALIVMLNALLLMKKFFKDLCIILAVCQVGFIGFLYILNALLRIN